jgi:iron(III) transport system permease protein
MTAWRVVYLLGLAVFVVTPLVTPFRDLGSASTWNWSEEDAARLQHLAFNTLTLSFGSAFVGLPLGLALAVLLFRTSLIGRSFGVLLLAVSLFVPLPIIVSSWQGAFGANGWLPLAFMQSDVDRPWATGMTAAIVIHALASVPWIAFIVGIGLNWIEPELEDEAAQSVGPWRVLIFVTLPRVRASIAAAALFVILQTAGEISVTDMMLVDTLARETYTQFAINRDALARSSVVSLPVIMVGWLVVLGIVTRLESTLPPLAPSARPLRLLELGPLWLRTLVVVALLALLLVPLGSLAWRLGLTGHPGQWTFDAASRFLQSEAGLLGKDLFASLGTSLGAGVLVTLFALVGCWLARDARWFRLLLFSVATLAWVLPGPLVGIGLRDLILGLPEGMLKDSLYYASSPLPLMWVQCIRALPIAVVFLWPIVRMIPRAAFEEARQAGAGPIAEWWGIVVPLTRRGGMVAALAVAAICLGEVAASTCVSTPGWESFAKLIFDRMHYGVDNNVSALCVLMLLSLLSIAIGGFVLGMLLQFGRKPPVRKIT